MRTLLLFLLIAVALFGCSKEDRLRQKYSGLYTVNSQERTWYAPDSTVTYDDAGTLGLYDNDNNPFNNVVHVLEPWPLSWERNLVGGFFQDVPVGWYTDDVDGSTITFFSNDGDAFLYATFTIERSGSKGYTWTYVENDTTGTLSYREVWEVTRQ
ncbi:MAG: hypothetical protein KA941_08080 [Flavobacteriales bacterium]|nr:hypothetical protein [Flavobacteriales bacterium]